MSDSVIEQVQLVSPFLWRPCPGMDPLVDYAQSDNVGSGVERFNLVQERLNAGVSSANPFIVDYRLKRFFARRETYVQGVQAWLRSSCRVGGPTIEFGCPEFDSQGNSALLISTEILDEVRAQTAELCSCPSEDDVEPIPNAPFDRNLFLFERPVNTVREEEGAFDGHDPIATAALGDPMLLGFHYKRGSPYAGAVYALPVMGEVYWRHALYATVGVAIFCDTRTNSRVKTAIRLICSWFEQGSTITRPSSGQRHELRRWSKQHRLNFLPQPYYTVKIPKNQTARKTTVMTAEQKRASLTFRHERRGHRRLYVHRGQEDLSELLEKGYTVWGPGDDLGPLAAEHLARRGHGPKQENEWLAARVVWVTDTIVGDESLPYIPSTHEVPQ